MPLTQIPSTGIKDAAVTSTQMASTIALAGNITGANLISNAAISVTSGGTGQISYTNGQLLIGNTTSGGLDKTTLTAGNGVTITNGVGSITIAAAGLPTMNIVSGTTQAAVAGNHYVLTNVAATTVTLPASPNAGDVVWVSVGNGLTTNVIARNGQNIQRLAQDMTLDTPYAAVQLRYVNATIGWTFT